MRRTGRASGAIAHAVDALVRRGLIDVLDGDDRPLPTPAERRRCLGRLYYRLHRPEGETVAGRAKPVAVNPIAVNPIAVKSAAAKSEHAKPHTTKNTVYKNKQQRKPEVDKAVEKPFVMKKPFVIRSNGWVRATDILSRPSVKDQSAEAKGREGRETES